MNRWQRMARRVRRAAGAILVAGLLAGASGCAGLALSGGEQELLDQSTAEARFMDRTWAARPAAEQADFVHQNALRWQAFADLVHGRRPATVAAGGEVRP